MIYSEPKVCLFTRERLDNPDLRCIHLLFSYLDIQTYALVQSVLEQRDKLYQTNTEGELECESQERGKIEKSYYQYFYFEIFILTVFEHCKLCIIHEYKFIVINAAIQMRNLYTLLKSDILFNFIQPRHSNHNPIQSVHSYISCCFYEYMITKLDTKHDSKLDY